MAVEPALARSEELTAKKAEKLTPELAFNIKVETYVYRPRTLMR